jgi:hypothetical protein
VLSTGIATENDDAVGSDRLALEHGQPTASGVVAPTARQERGNPLAFYFGKRELATTRPSALN